MAKKSSAWRLNQEDVKKWGKNMLVFLAPLALVYLASIQNRINNGEVSIEIFKITPEIAGALILYLLNALTDLFKKFSQGKG